jgi:hypothetical protein
MQASAGSNLHMKARRRMPILPMQASMDGKPPKKAAADGKPLKFKKTILTPPIKPC